MKATRGRGRGRGRGGGSTKTPTPQTPTTTTFPSACEQSDYTETDLRAAMNAHGAGLLGALGQQMNAHLTSLSMLEGATSSLRGQCQNMVVEIGKLLEAIELYQTTHAQVLIHATLLRQIVAEFAQHIHNSQVFGA